MSSYIERLIDLLERCAQNKEYAPQFLEDIEWAIDTIGKNKLNTGADKTLDFDGDKRPEIKAWIDLIKL